MRLHRIPKLLTVVFFISEVVLNSSCSVPTARSLEPRNVTYRARGNAGRVIITYNNETNGTTTVNPHGDDYSMDGNLRWSETIAIHAGDVASLIVRNEGSYGNVIAEIIYEGRVVKSSESNGEYGMATVSGLVP